MGSRIRQTPLRYRYRALSSDSNMGVDAGLLGRGINRHVTTVNRDVVATVVELDRDVFGRRGVGEERLKCIWVRALEQRRDVERTDILRAGYLLDDALGH